jgi:hypothetical protein
MDLRVRLQQDAAANCTVRTSLFLLHTKYEYYMTIPRRMGWVGYVVCVGEERNSYTELSSKRYGKRPPLRPKQGPENTKKASCLEI